MLKGVDVLVIASKDDNSSCVKKAGSLFLDVANSNDNDKRIEYYVSLDTELRESRRSACIRTCPLFIHISNPDDHVYLSDSYFSLNPELRASLAQDGFDRVTLYLHQNREGLGNLICRMKDGLMVFDEKEDMDFSYGKSVELFLSKINILKFSLGERGLDLSNDPKFLLSDYSSSDCSSEEDE